MSETTAIPAAAIEAAAAAILTAQNASDDEPERWEARMLAEAALGAAAPAIREQGFQERMEAYKANMTGIIAGAAAAAERAKFRAILDRGKVEWMIHAFDLIDQLLVRKGMETGGEVQDDLRKLADLLDEEGER